MQPGRREACRAPRFGSPWSAVLAIACLSILTACAPPLAYYVQLDQTIAQQRYADADKLIEKSQDHYGARNAVLYRMDRAMALHLAGKYADSNRQLDQAERRIESLYTKSIAAETGAMFTNDNLLPYEGEDFEKVMINLLASVNYALLGKWEDALVEARKVDHKLTLLNDRYQKKNIYKEDAFVRYLTGVLYETMGEWNDAFIAYRKADETYREYEKDYGTSPPSELPADLLRLSEALGLEEEFGEYRKRFPDVPFESNGNFVQKGEIVLLGLNGRSPIKEDAFIDAPIPDGRGGTYLLRVALPRFVPIPSEIGRTEIRVRNTSYQTSATAEPVEDITAIGKKNLEDRIGRITAKAVARATAKYLAAQEVRKRAAKEGGQAAEALAGFLTNVYSVASEQADTRSWRTLPGIIDLARIPVSPGTYDVEVITYGTSGQVLQRTAFPQTAVGAGEKRFLSVRMAR